MKLTGIKRRFIGKGCQTLKRVVIPCCVLFILFNFLTAPSEDLNKFPPPVEEDMIVPGEALDPIIRKQAKPNVPKKYVSIVKKENSDKFSKVISAEDSFGTRGHSPESPVLQNARPLNSPQMQRKTTHSEKKSDRIRASFDEADVPSRMDTAWSMAKANIPDMDKVRFKGHAITNDTITLTLMSSADKVFMSINKKEIYRGLDKRGLHVVVLNQYNGRVMAKRVFDTFQIGVEDGFVDFIDDITNGRIIVLAVEDDIATSLTWKGRNKLKELGCRFADRIAFRDMWAMVTRKDGLKIAETFSNVATADTGYEWGGPIFMRTDFDLEERPVECEWPFNERNQARRLFCVRYEGYGKLCRCDVLQWDDVFFQVDQKLHRNLASTVLYKDLGVIILATNRTHSLYRTLKSLHEAPGFNKDVVAIYAESPTREVVQLAKLFGITVVETQKLTGITTPALIRHKMQRVLQDVFGAKFAASSVPDGAPSPDSALPPFNLGNILVLEEDISVSIDIFKYLHAVYPVLEKDPTVLAISAFNYHAYRDVVDSQSNSYRTTTPQGLALLLTRKTVNNVLVPHWPSAKDEDTDWYVGLDEVMKGENSIVYPEISRAKHDSYDGYLVAGGVQSHFFRDHVLSITTNYEISQQDVDRLILSNYEKAMKKTLKESETIEFDFCKHDLVYNTNTYIMYVDYDTKNDTNWSYIMNCLKAWSLYPMGGWRGVWQFHYHGHPLTIVGVPASPYSSFKPAKYQLVIAPPNSTTLTTSTSPSRAKN